MTIALFSDVHANLPAFEAFRNDLDKRKPDAVYCLGDLIGYHVWPNEIIDDIRKRGIATIAGNHDLKVNSYPPVEPSLLEKSGIGYAYHIVQPSNKAYLNSLPGQIALTFGSDENKINLVLVHGSPRSINEYLVEDLDEAYVAGLMNEAGAHILCAGHSHIPYHRVIENGQGTYHHIINIGSVGKPKDKDPRGCYVMLTINENSRLDDKNSITVEFVRFEYSVEKSALAIENSPLPRELAARLRDAF